jgi:hypothetical protein
MPSAVRDIVEKFVAEHHVEQTFFKRVRDRSSPPARRAGGSEKES